MVLCNIDIPPFPSFTTTSLPQQMHKWAEQQNKKELKTTTSDKAGNNSVFKTPMLPMAPKKATADAGFNMLQKKVGGEDAVLLFVIIGFL